MVVLFLNRLTVVMCFYLHINMFCLHNWFQSQWKKLCLFFVVVLIHELEILLSKNEPPMHILRNRYGWSHRIWRKVDLQKYHSPFVLLGEWIEIFANILIYIRFRRNFSSICTRSRSQPMFRSKRKRRNCFEFLLSFQLLSSNLTQEGHDDEGMLGFLPADIKKEVQRAKNMVCCCWERQTPLRLCCVLIRSGIFHFSEFL